MNVKEKPKLKPRAFLISRQEKYNTDNLEKLGKRIFLLDKIRNVYNVDDIVSDAIKSMEKNNFNQEVDCVVLTGHVITLCLFMAAAASKYNRLNLLMFNWNTSEYTQRVIDFRTLPCNTILKNVKTNV